MQKRFEDVRQSLETQYQHPCLDPESGMDAETLKSRIFDFYESHRMEPLIAVRAELLSMVLRNARIGVDGADRFADHLGHGGVLIALREKICAEVCAAMPAEFQDKVREYARCGAFVAALDISHTSPDWESLLTLGATGLRDRALEALHAAESEEEKIFCRAVIQVYDSFLVLLRRFPAQAQKQNAPEIAAVFRALAERPPETFREALQLALIYDTCQELEGEPVRSQGLFDRLFYRFYRHDLEHGILSREEAKELLKFYWTKFYAQMHPNGKNFCFGGLAAPGVDGSNELTGVCFEIHKELNRINPKLSFRVHRKTPETLLRSVADCVRTGRTAIVFSNDEVAFEMFRRRGKEEHDLYSYLLIGCYEPAIMGREMCCSMSAWGSLVTPLEAVFHNGCAFSGERIGPECTLPATPEEFEHEYLRQLGQMLDRVMERVKVFERHWKDINPSPLLSGTMADCMRTRRDVSEGGTRYNTSGIMCAGLGTVVDSIAAVRMLVGERHLCTIAQLGEILRRNWEGAEHLRLLAWKRAPKWGNGNREADEIGRRIMKFVSRRINQTPNARGGTFQTGEWSINHNFTFGKKTAATPDGRFAGEPLSRNTGASIGCEKHGVTALIRSAAELDHAEFPDGSVLDVMLHPSSISSNEGPDVIAGLVRSYFAAGGLAIQFNILNAEDLKLAQMEPGKYDDLQVRVCGWNSRFVNLSREEQNAFIAQAEAAQ